MWTSWLLWYYWEKRRFYIGRNGSKKTVTDFRGKQPKLLFCVITKLNSINFVGDFNFYFDTLLETRDDDQALTLSWRRPLSYRNQSIDLQRKSMDWFLYDNVLRHERVKEKICRFYEWNWRTFWSLLYLED